MKRAKAAIEACSRSPARAQPRAIASRSLAGIPETSSASSPLQSARVVSAKGSWSASASQARSRACVEIWTAQFPAGSSEGEGSHRSRRLTAESSCIEPTAGITGSVSDLQDPVISPRDRPAMGVNVVERG